jgi:Xaa-Pro aminopeptidase
MDVISRLNTLTENLRSAGAEALWISSPHNHLYFSGFDNPDGRVLVTLERAYVFADFRYAERARATCGGFAEVIETRDPVEFLPEIFKKHGVVSAAIEEDHLVCEEYDRLKDALPGVRFFHFARKLTEQRQKKTADEVRLIAAAQDIADAAFAHILTLLPGNYTEAGVAAELEYFMKKNGATGLSFDTIAVSNKSSSSPHAIPAHKPLENGFLTMDFGAEIDGYRSDMTRTVVIGKADDEMRRLYDTVLRAQLSVLDVIGPGVDCGEMHMIAQDIIDGAGYAGRFGHGLGHGVGILIHEEPVLNPKRSGRKLVPGDVVTVEPGIYIEGKYGCRIEDMVLVTEDGIMNFTHSPKELIEIG